ncbi:MAG: efflux RND transporter periplasmic adaptor subunit [Marinifilaceae bacterium]|jgi:RND family efflux transporter MFP subunit
MRKNLLTILCLSIFAVGLASCGHKEKPVKVIRPVRAIQLSQEVNQDNATYPGTVSESREVKLAFRVPGPLIKLNAKEGQFVKKGSLIAQIDPRDFEIKVAATKARYEQARAEAERFKNLYKKKSVAKNTLDKIMTAHELAEAEYDAAKNALKDTRLVAPFSGYINMKFVENFEKVGAGHPIVSLLDVSRLEVKAWIPEDMVVKAADFTDFYCEFDAYPGMRMKASLKEIGKKASISKQTYPITVILEVPENLSIRSGMNSRLHILVSNEKGGEGFEVPTSAVINQNNRTLVWIFNQQKGQVTSREVKVGSLKSGNRIEVLNGLKPGEIVVTAGANFLIENQQVRLLETASKTNVGGQL